MLHHGGETKKGTFLYSSRPEVADISDFAETPWRTQGTGTLELVTGTDGKVSGNKVGLKMSQTYPAAFGRALCRVWDRHKADLMANIGARIVADAQLDLDVHGLLAAPLGDSWDDARLNSVFEFLGYSFNTGLPP